MFDERKAREKARDYVDALYQVGTDLEKRFAELIALAHLTGQKAEYQEGLTDATRKILQPEEG